MNEMDGKFICPICNYNGIIWEDYPESNKEDFKHWLYRNEYVNNKLEKKWVFYGGKKKVDLLLLLWRNYILWN